MAAPKKKGRGRAGRDRRGARIRARRPLPPALRRRAAVLGGRPLRLVPGQLAAQPAFRPAGTSGQLSALHKQDAALAQEKKNLSDAGEIGRIAREQYQFVDPGQRAYEVLPPSGAAAAGHALCGRPRFDRPGHPVGHARAPSGGCHDDDHAGRPRRTGHDTGSVGFVGACWLACCTRSSSGADRTAVDDDEAVAALLGRDPGGNFSSWSAAGRHADGHRERAVPARRDADADPLLARRSRAAGPGRPARGVGRCPPSRARRGRSRSGGMPSPLRGRSATPRSRRIGPGPDRAVASAARAKASSACTPMWRGGWPAGTTRSARGWHNGWSSHDPGNERAAQLW